MIIIKSCASCIPLCQVLKVCIPDYVQVPLRHRESGDKLSSHCFFQSNTSTTVVKISKWKLIYMNFIKSKINVHDICFVRFGMGVPELCPFIEIVKSVWRKFVYQTSSTVKSSFLFFKSQIKLLENSYIDDSKVCIVL